MTDELYKVSVKYEDVNFATFNDNILGGVTNMASPTIIAGKKSAMVESAATAAILANGLRNLNASLGKKNVTTSLLMPRNAPIIAPESVLGLRLGSAELDKAFKKYNRSAFGRSLAYSSGVKLGFLRAIGSTPKPSGLPTSVAHKSLGLQFGLKQQALRYQWNNPNMPNTVGKVLTKEEIEENYNKMAVIYRQHMGK